MPKKLFQKGQSGNPGGRPKADQEFRALASAHTPKAIETLAMIMNSQKARLADRVRAAEVLLKKVLPDLSSVDSAVTAKHTMNVISDKPMTVEEWKQAYAEQHSHTEH